MKLTNEQIQEAIDWMTVNTSFHKYHEFLLEAYKEILELRKEVKELNIVIKDLENRLEQERGSCF